MRLIQGPCADAHFQPSLRTGFYDMYELFKRFVAHEVCTIHFQDYGFDPVCASASMRFHIHTLE